MLLARPEEEYSECRDSGPQPHQLEGGQCHGGLFVHRVERAVPPQVLTALHEGRAVPQLQQDGLHEHQRGREEVDKVPRKVRAVGQQRGQPVGTGRCAERT